MRFDKRKRVRRKLERKKFKGKKRNRRKWNFERNEEKDVEDWLKGKRKNAKMKKRDCQSKVL